MRPLVVCSYARVAADEAELTDSVGGKAHRVSSVPRVLDALERFLLTCDGNLTMDEVVGRIDVDEEPEELIDAVEQFIALGLIIDSRACADYATQLLSRLMPMDDERVDRAYALPMWTDGRVAKTPVARETERPVARNRVASLTAEDLQVFSADRTLPVTPTDQELRSLIRSAYGWSNGHRVVPSAGATWPLVFHALTPSAVSETYDLKWFDQEAEAFADVPDLSISTEDFRSCMSPNPVVDLSLATGAVVLVISGDLRRSGLKYGTRAAHFALVEAGGTMQRIYEHSAAASLGVRAMGGFNTRRLSKSLGLDDLNPLLVMLVASRSVSGTPNG